MERKYSIPLKVLHRTRVALNQFDDYWNKYVDIKMSRNAAKHLRKRIISENGKTLVPSQQMAEIKSYCRSALGSSAYWPWLAYYTELRGEFCEGWIPEDYYRFEVLPRINPEKFIRFSEAKTIDHKIFNGFMLDPLLFRSNGQYYNQHGDIKTMQKAQQLLLEFNDEVIIKPDAGRGGKSIIFKHSAELDINELPTDFDFVIQKVVKQHPELNRLYPHSINTFRIMTYLSETGEVEVKFIVIRFGTGGARVDNTSQGGGWMFVQQDGTPEPGGYSGLGFLTGTQHPDTGTKYADLKLPFIHKITALCKEAHRSFPYTRIIGWDAFIDEDEEVKLIEWNANNPFWTAIEARFGPFLKELVVPN